MNVKEKRINPQEWKSDSVVDLDLVGSASFWQIRTHIGIGIQGLPIRIPILSTSTKRKAKIYLYLENINTMFTILKNYDTYDADEKD
jgi:hypothetical protein